MTHIKTWQERAGTFKETYLGAAALAHADTHLHVQAELNELRTALAQQGEPVAYEFRMRADWVPDWGLWSPCNKEQHAMYIRAPKIHDWHYETRALYAAAPAAQAQPVAQPLTGPCHTCDHYQQGKRPGVSIHGETCYVCSEYYANKWEAKSD